MAHRTGFHAVLDLLPSLSRGELLNVAFRVAGLTGPLIDIEAPQKLLLQTKARMQQVLRDRPLAEWGEALAPFVAEARRQGFHGNGSPVAQGLQVLFAFPRDGFTKTRDPRLDPPVRVTGEISFGLTPSWPPRWPERVPQDWERFFLVDLAVKDAAGAEFVDVRVPYKRFAENRGWAKALDLNVIQFCASKALWYYDGPT